MGCIKGETLSNRRSIAFGAQCATEHTHGKGIIVMDSLENSRYTDIAVDLEPGWAATRALMCATNDTLLTVMLRPSFRPISDQEFVPVRLCPYCRDGGIRTAGGVRTRHGREIVRACDTCGAVEIGTVNVGGGRAYK